MTVVTNFLPKAQATSAANLAAFVEMWKSKTSVFKSVNWDDDIWDITNDVIRPGTGQTRLTLYFSTFDDSRPQVRTNKACMSQPFLDFAKSYMLYIKAVRPRVSYHFQLSALRALEKALIKARASANVQDTDGAVCNIAAAFIKERFSPTAAYGTARELNKLTEFLSEKRLVTVPFQWKNPLGINKISNRIGSEGDEARRKKMPSKAALDALPKCFLMATETRDIIATAIAALLCTSPDRISEVFSLPVNCEVTQNLDGKTIYGLRWWPRKGAATMVKWIAPSMVDVAKTAVAKLRETCAPARAVATWYKSNPGKLFLSDDLEHLRSKNDLTINDVAAILGLRTNSSTHQWCRSHRVPLQHHPGQKYRGSVRFSDLEKAVLGMLPKSFPVICRQTGLHYDEALVLLRLNEASAQWQPFLPMVAPVGTALINAVLGGRSYASVFTRFGFKEPDGSPIVVTSHQFRHWLNTMAHRGGMSQIDIAKWSGRKDISQNEAYDHMTGNELVAMARSMTDGDGRLFGPLAELAAKAPVSRDEFMELEFPTAHVTELGFCVHDYTMLPCQRHRDCVNCNEHVCVKGDRDKTTRIRRHLEVAEERLRRAEGAKADGYVGADRWHEHHQASVQRLRRLVEILDDPDIPMGSLVRLTNRDEFSPIAMAAEERKQLGVDDMFAEAALLLGGA